MAATPSPLNRSTMPPANLPLRDIDPIPAVLVGMEGLTLLVDGQRRWSANHRLRFVVGQGAQAAAGVLEVRDEQPDGRLRCRIVRIDPEAAERMQQLTQATPIALFDDITTLTPTGERGRRAFRDALRDRVQQMRQTRL